MTLVLIVLKPHACALVPEAVRRALAVGKSLNVNRLYDLALGRSEPVR